jgi:hypothetical protein
MTMNEYEIRWLLGMALLGIGFLFGSVMGYYYARQTLRG